MHSPIQDLMTTYHTVVIVTRVDDAGVINIRKNTCISPAYVHCASHPMNHSNRLGQSYNVDPMAFHGDSRHHSLAIS